MTDYFPERFSVDGTTSYVREMQAAARAAAASGKPLVFPPMTYLVDDPGGIELFSGTVVELHGAKLKVDPGVRRDGQVFVGRNVERVIVLGGEIDGSRDSLPDSVNVAGIRFYGSSRDITVDGLFAHDLSSNAVGVFGGGDDAPAREITITSLRAEACGSKYVDYLDHNPGPVPGADREDQGDIALYHVVNFSIADCRLVRARSDASHIYRCRDGRVERTLFQNAKMGGYFIESSERITCRESTVDGCGSRGVTIERGSRQCDVFDTVVRGCGREGFWLDDSGECELSGNVIEDNGQKRDGITSCNINVQDNSWPNDTANPRSRDIVIRRNRVHSGPWQAASIRVCSAATNVTISDNDLEGEMKRLQPDCWSSGVGRVVTLGNRGWRTEASGTAVLDGDGSTTTFRFPHTLDLPFPLARLRGIELITNVTSLNAGNSVVSVSRTDTDIVVRLKQAPPVGKANVAFDWQALLRYPA